MKKVVAAFIVLISIHVLCTAQSLKTSPENSGIPVATGLNKTNLSLITTATTVSELSKPEGKPKNETQINYSVTDSFAVKKGDDCDKVHPGKRKDSIQKNEIRDLRNQRINKFAMGLAQFLNYL